MPSPSVLLELSSSSTGATARVTLNAPDGEILEDSGIVDVFGLDAAFELAVDFCRIKAHPSFEFEDRRHPGSRRFGIVVVDADPGLPRAYLEGRDGESDRDRARRATSS
jgi:hypothetical protein